MEDTHNDTPFRQAGFLREEYWHLEATSTPDNENKNRVRIIHLEGDTETTTFHTQRYQHETDGVLYRSRLDTAECHQVQEQHTAFELDKRRKVTTKLLRYEHQSDPTSSELGFKVEMFTKQQRRINQGVSIARAYLTRSYDIMVNIDADHPTTAPAATAQLTALGVTCKMLQFSLEQH